MPDSNDYIHDLLNLISNSVYRKRQQKRVPGSHGYRTTESVTEETEIDEHNATDSLLVQDEIILDCGHRGSELNGRVHCCDTLLCTSCMQEAECVSCGFQFCSVHRTRANFDDAEKTYCRECYSEIRRQRRLINTGRGLLSFFVKTDTSHESK